MLVSRDGAVDIYRQQQIYKRTQLCTLPYSIALHLYQTQNHLRTFITVTPCSPCHPWSSWSFNSFTQKDAINQHIGNWYNYMRLAIIKLYPPCETVWISLWSILVEDLMELATLWLASLVWQSSMPNTKVEDFLLWWGSML